jgi:asparagine synthase (glutamine-hydrolysing)
MCGIAGTYQQVDGRAAALRMGSCLEHRGPDEAGEWSFTNDQVDVHFVHRRLSIIDLQHGQQPLVKPPLVLCYNGEIYNYREIRAELVSGGSSFTTSSDTEVVLEAWRRWGPACLKRFRGMFAFALLDQRTGSLFLARDQFGIKPLHYMRRKDGVVFASEMKALVSTFGNELHISTQGLVASMLYYWIPDQMCSLRGIDRVPPGTWGEFRPDGTSHLERYWDVAEEAAAAQECRWNLREVIEDSVNAHLVADVPVSSFLSGGLDSSIVTVLAKQANPQIDAYTITFRD